jgi:hypothetical protein
MPLLRRCLAWLMLIALSAGPALAANDAADSGKPNAVSEPRNSAPTPGSSACPDRPPPGVGKSSTLVVALASDTLWRPRGGEVRFTITGAGQTAVIHQVHVCFGWSSTAASAEADTFHALQGSPLVRAITSSTGAPTYGATMPDLVDVVQEWWDRPLGPNRLLYTGVYSVPLADMVVEVTPEGGTATVVVLPVGVTSVSYATILVALCALLFCVATAVLVRRRGIPGRNFLLRLVSTRDGYASLSQFQIILWTVVVGLSAVYVMTLSGNLIPITTGTLVLLGIAAAAALLARVPAGGSAAPDQVQPAPAQPAPAQPAPAQPAVPNPAPGPPQAPRQPRWSDLVTVDGAADEIDVTRVQMLIFTLISAAFVGLKVIVSYEIPAIPENFQLLMGISNGVYIAGRHLPSPGKGQAA